MKANLKFYSCNKSQHDAQFLSVIFRNIASCWLLLQEYITMHGPLNVKWKFYFSNGDIVINIDTIHMLERTLKIEFKRTI